MKTVFKLASVHGTTVVRAPTPHCHRQSTRDEKCTGEGARQARIHVVGSDFVVALVRLRAQRYDETKLKSLACARCCRSMNN